MATRLLLPPKAKTLVALAPLSGGLLATDTAGDRWLPSRTCKDDERGAAAVRVMEVFLTEARMSADVTIWRRGRAPGPFRELMEIQQRKASSFFSMRNYLAN